MPLTIRPSDFPLGQAARANDIVSAQWQDRQLPHIIFPETLHKFRHWALGSDLGSSVTPELPATNLDTNCLHSAEPSPTSPLFYCPRIFLILQRRPCNLTSELSRKRMIYFTVVPIPKVAAMHFFSPCLHAIGRFNWSAWSSLEFPHNMEEVIFFLHQPSEDFWLNSLSLLHKSNFQHKLCALTRCSRSTSHGVNMKECKCFYFSSLSIHFFFFLTNKSRKASQNYKSSGCVFAPASLWWPDDGILTQNETFYFHLLFFFLCAVHLLPL